jgi:tetratricopeptide (TPR) repeat protein
MSRKKALESSASALAQVEIEAAAAPHPGVIASAVGDSASAEALDRLNRQAQETKKAEYAKPLARAIQAVKLGDYATADKTALKLLEKDERLGLAWHILAIAREKTGDFASSLRAYEAALKLLPDHGPVAGDLGRLAFRMNMPEIAAQFFAHYRLARPDDIEGANNLACALRELNRESEAIEVLKTAIGANPTAALLWNTLGTVLCNIADSAGSLVFFDEALRLEPEFAKAYHNRAFAKLDLGDAQGALADCEFAMRHPGSAEDLAMMRFARATILLGLGRLAEGWEAYEARFSPDMSEAPRFHIPGTRWSGEDLRGKTLMISTEQGLGDEVMFANMLPDILERLGPDGALTLAVQRRLVPLFQRSFPGTEVTAHRTVALEGRVFRTAPEVEDWDRFDYWAAIGDFLPSLRGSIEAFPKTADYLKPDPARVAHWKAELAKLGPAPKVGLLWKSLKLNAERARQFSPFEAWRAVLRTPGATFVNLQYGDCDDEIAYAKEELGVDIWQPPGIDLKQDLDDVTALCAAVDLVIGFSNATANLAGAVGTPMWLLTPPAAWTKLGDDHYPWYPQTRVFSPADFSDWNPVMSQIARALAEKVAGAK